MKRSIIIGIALGSLTVSSAMAADPDFAAKGPYGEPVYSWTGCYAGIHAGGGLHTSSFVDDVAVAGVGAVAGGQVGCNYQYNQIVVGLEGEAFWSGLNTQRAETDPTVFSDTAQSDNRYDGTVALRLGYAFDRLLAYGKVGAAFGNFAWSEADSTFTAPTAFYNATAAQTIAGFLFGFGFEYALADRWSAKIEYNYIDYGDPVITFAQTCVGAGCGTFPSSFSSTEKEIKQIVKVGLNYRFY